MSVQADTKEMLFADTAALGLPGLILLAVAIVAFIVWLAVGTREPDLGDVLGWIVAGVLGVVVIAYAGSWHEVAIDPATRRVAERHGYLGFELSWMGQQRGFQDFTTVLVERTTSKESTDKPKRTRKAHSYTLSLRGARTQVDLPMATRDDVFFHLRAKPQGSGVTLPPMETSGDVLVLETAARQVARLGSWEAKRHGYALRGPRGEAADRRPDQRPQDVRDRPAAPRAEPGSGKSGWFYQLPFMPKQKAAPELQNSPVGIEIVATDAESLIEAR
ncbi:MAG: hypothetical protein HYX43_15880 [Burkholderiales bacterium]|nr:hypothetical protein [Burkholderiales bacterium]